MNRERTCVCCRNIFSKDELIRIVRTKDGNIKIDLTGKVAGRGAYVCKSRKCMEILKSDKLKRVLKCNVSEDIVEELSHIIENKAENIMNA